MESPCTGVCALAPSNRHCLGCGRTIDEIALWSAATPEQKAAILDRLRREWPRQAGGRR